MVAIVKVDKVKYNGVTRVINICITPNGKRIASIGGFYFPVSNDNTVNKKLWYVGTETVSGSKYEIWQYEKLTESGYKIAERKKLIA
jgi:hypothetical protein